MYFKLSRSSTLFYTSSELVEAEASDLRHNPGSLYGCSLENYGEECTNPQRLAVGLDTATPPADSGWFSLMNLQLFKEESDFRDDVFDADVDASSFSVYASTLRPTKYEGFFTWKILRANAALPFNRDLSMNSTIGDEDESLLFHTYFRTLSEFDWNNCNFQCCPFGENVSDSNGKTFNRSQDVLAFQHSYVRTKPRSFAVDHRTGDIFVAWEGFYVKCDPSDMNQYLKWSIGVSRLLTHAENPACVSTRNANGEIELPSDLGELGNNFVSCTEPVAIVDVDTRSELSGRRTGLPYGGLAVVSAVKDPSLSGFETRRSFLLSAFRKHDKYRAVASHLWSVPEGFDASQNLDKRQNLTSPYVFNAEFDSSLKGSGIWNGGNIKVHYNQQTGRPDHLCRSVFREGITCMPIEMTDDNDSIKLAPGRVMPYLKKSEVEDFCDTGQPSYDIVPSTEFHKRGNKYVSGLDVLWNENDGFPFKIFFGCVGIESNGRLGSVERYGGDVAEVLPNAFSGDVLLLPGETSSFYIGKQPTYDDLVSTDTETTSSSDIKRTVMFEPRGIAVISVVIAALCIILYCFYRKPSPSTVSSRKSNSATPSDESNENRRAETTQNEPNSETDSNEADETLPLQISNTPEV